MSDYLAPEEVRDVVRPALIKHVVTWRQIVNPDRRAHFVAARRDVYLALREGTDMSYPEIGRLVDRHHTTVLHHVKAARRVAS